MGPVPNEAGLWQTDLRNWADRYNWHLGPIPLNPIAATYIGLHDQAVGAGDTMGRYDSGKASFGEAVWAVGTFSANIVGSAFLIEGAGAGLVSRLTATPASATLAGSDATLAAAAAKVKPLPGYYDVVVHGTQDAFQVFHNGQWVTISHRSLARYIEKSGYSGGPIRLISCNSGGSVSGAAQNLANKLGADVLAPNKTAWIHGSGRITVGNPWYNSGGWNHFHPGGP